MRVLAAIGARVLLTALAIALSSGRAQAQQVNWGRGDYGPVLSTHIDAGGRTLGDRHSLPANELGNYVFRGRVISLTDDRQTNLIFDTEHLRVAAAWTGGYVEWEGASKNMGPAIRGTILFQTPIGPGWSHAGQWDDPRDVPEGPLPTAWGRFDAMQLTNRGVVLEYRVAGTQVRELAGAVTLGGGAVAITRTFVLGPTDQPQGLLVAALPAGQGSAGPPGVGVETTTADAAGSVARLAGEASVVAAIVQGDIAGARWEAVDGRLHLLLPPREKPAALRVAIAALRPSEEKSLAELPPPTAAELRLADAKPRRLWPEEVVTSVTLGAAEGAYTVDDIGLPLDNPWRALVRPGAFDFFADGRAALSTWDGDVWLISGVGADSPLVRWRRYATGLQQPLGLKIIDGQIFVAGRDQLTRLVDTNGDGEADRYENINNEPGLTPQRHEYVMDLQTDANGDLYYCRSGHYLPSLRGENCCIFRLRPDGSSLAVFARGLREPNGMAIGPDGLITVADNEGDGIPQTPLYAVRPGDFFGYRGALRKGEQPGPWAPPFLWLPKQADASAGGQVWATSDRWGPLGGALLHTSYGQCRLLHVMLDRSGDALQGAARVLPLTFASGVMRGRMNPVDGQLYLCGLRGWGSSAAKDGQFCRVRYTGQPLDGPVAWRVTADAIEFSFAEPLDRAAAEDDQNWALAWWSVPYGEVKAKPKDEPFLDAIELSSDGRTVTLTPETLGPVTNFELEYRLRSAAGRKVDGVLYGTINAVPGGE